jgi:two-component system phosphate regulon sensor histidine kinase PhoR
MILSSILLTRRSAYRQGTFAVALFGLLLAGHHLGWTRTLPGLGPSGSVRLGPAVIVGWLVAFASTVYIAVYLTSTIVGKLRQREQELEVSNRKLAEQDRLKSQYVLQVSHDIQAALSAIHSLLMTVLGGFAGQIASQSRELIERASVRSQQLLRFVRDLLDISRMRTEVEVERHPVALLQVLRDQVELFRAPLQTKSLVLEIEVADTTRDEVHLWANSTAVVQLLNNLISNAVRYTPEGGRINVSVRPLRGQNMVEICIADTGIGIPPESLPQVFNDFFRAPNARSYADSGTGLGLAIVKKIVESHGGAIRVESEVGKGTTFFFTLPEYVPKNGADTNQNRSVVS